MVKDSPERFERIIELVSELCENDPIHERIVGGLDYLAKNLTTGLDERLKNRVLKVGAIKLLREANVASAYYAKGGDRIWAQGMLKVLNAGMRYKFHLKEEMGGSK
jgi:hypothetical protein